MLVAAFENNGVYRAPAFGRFVKHVHHAYREELVRNGEIEPHKVHCLGAPEGRVEVLGIYVEGQVAPVQPKRGEAGILHRGRGRMLDGMAVHRAIARAGINRL